MSTASASRKAVSSTSHEDVNHTTQHVVIVHECSRLGRKANPPRFSLTDWFRFGRRR
jgi:hypothetical protein